MVQIASSIDVSATLALEGCHRLDNHTLPLPSEWYISIGLSQGCVADIQLMLAAQCHLGTKNLDFQMERYVFKRRNDGINVINLAKTWEKLQLAARIIVAIENPQA